MGALTAADRRTFDSPDWLGWRRQGTRAGWTLLAAVAVLLTGCNGGVHWEGPTFPDAQARARRANKLTFVYFRSWYLVECTDFEEKVLKDPQVLAETRDLVCVALDFDWDQPLALKWQLKVAPAFAVVAPSGKVLARQQAPVTRADLLRDIRAARETFAAGAQPNGASAPPP